MQDLPEAMKAAAPRPTRALDPREVWRRGRLRRRSRLVVISCAVLAVAGLTWSFVGSGSSDSLFDRGRVQPGDGAGEPTRPNGSVLLAFYEEHVGSVDTVPMLVVDLETGGTRSVVVPEFGPGDALFPVVPTGGEIVFRGSSGTEAGTYAIDSDLEGDPVLLGESWYFVPSATDGRVWLTILDPDSPSTVRGLKGVREVTVDGEVTVADTGPPPGDSIVGSVRQGLVIQKEGLLVWDPWTERIVTRIDGVFPIDTSGDVIAWCDRNCPEVHLTNVATGLDSVIAPLPGMTFAETYNGAFSPDTRSLALPVIGDGGEQVAIVDLSTMTVDVVPDSILSTYHLMTWSASGDWLIFDTGAGHLSTFQPDTGESTIIPLDPSKRFFTLSAL